MKSRLLTSLLVLESAAAAAQGISGTFTATWTGTDVLGVPTTHLELALQCDVACPASAPRATFAVTGDVSVAYAADVALVAGWVSWGFVSGVRETGFSQADVTTLPAGASVVLTAKRVTCGCGEAAPRSSLLDVTSNVVAIPPFVRPPLALPVQLGGDAHPSVAVAAAPRREETVVVHLVGAGVDRTERFTATQWLEGSSCHGAVTRSFEVAPSRPGTLTASAQVTGTPATRVSFEVVGEPEQGGGCSALSGPLSWFALLALVSARRPRT